MVRKLVVDVPDDLKDGFKIYCMKNGTSIHAQIIEFMQATLDGTEEHAEPTDGSQQTSMKTDSSQQIKETIFEVTLRRALGLKEKATQESPDFTDPLNIGL